MELNMIKQMERHARQDTSIISLGQGIPAGRAAAHIRQSVITALQNEADIDRYSDPLGMPILRETIAKHLSDTGSNYHADEILISSGAIEAINATLLTFVTAQKSEVIIPVPTYSAYSRAVHVAKGKSVPIQLLEHEDWRLHTKQVAAAITQNTAAILICNPNNPTGSLYDESTLLELCKLAKQHDILLIIDEVYGNMVYDQMQLYSPIQAAEFRKNVIRVVSFSKDFNLTGWRIGFLHADKSIVDRIVPVHDTLVNCAALPSQYAALAALEIAQETFTNNRHLYEYRRNLMKTYLDTLDPWVSYTLPGGGYFFFPKLLLNMTAQDFCNDLLKKEKLVCVPGIDFGDTTDKHFRLCFGRSISDIELGMKKLTHYLQTWHNGV